MSDVTNGRFATQVGKRARTRRLAPPLMVAVTMLALFWFAGIVAPQHANASNAAPQRSLQAAPGPDVAASKSVSSAYVQPGERITYTLTFSNAGDALATAIVLTDVLPAELTNLSLQVPGSVNSYSNIPPNLVFQIADLAPAASDSILIAGTVNPSVGRGTIFTNTATIVAGGGDVDPLNDQAAVAVTVADIAVAGLNATNDSPTLLGALTTFTATITAGTNVVYAWDFGDGNTGSGSDTGHTYAAPGNYTAIVTATNNTGNTSAQTQVTIVAPDVGIVKSVTPAQVDPGGVVTYTISYSNSGTARATGVVITDIVPSALISRSVASAGAVITDTASTPAYVWTVEDLAPGAGGAIRIVARLDNGATVGHLITNTAEIMADLDWNAGNRSNSAVFSVVDTPIAGLAATSDSPTMLGASTQFTATTTAGTNIAYTWNFGDGNLGSGTNPTHSYAAPGAYMAVVTATNGVGSVSASTPVTVQAADLGILKTAAASLIPPETMITYTISFTNAGSILAANTLITDVLPAELTDITVKSLNYPVSINLVGGSMYILSVGDLAAQDGGMIEVTGQLKPGIAVGTVFTNTVLIGSSTVDFGPGPNVSAAAVTVGDAPVTGLSATNDSPTLLGSATQFAANITAGTHVAYTWDFGDGQAGTGASPSYQYQAPGFYTAVVTATNNTSSLVTTTPVAITSAELTIAKTVDPTVVGPGDAVTFTLSFANTGLAVASGVRLTDTFPTQIDDVTIAVNGVGVNLTGFGPTYIWDLADMAPGAQGVITLRGVVNAATPLGTTLENTATLDTATPESDKSDNTASAASHVALAPIEGLIGAATNYKGIVPATGEILTFVASVEFGTSVHYAWNFGDGATATGPSALHAYARPGVYRVTVTATNDAGSVVYEFMLMVTEDGNPAFYTFLPTVRR